MARHQLFAALLLVGRTWGIIRQEFLNDMQHVKGPALSATFSREKWYPDQKLDHFNSSDQRVWRQRFFANFDHFRPGGPIIINIGGEGSLNDRAVDGAFANALFAEKMQGATVALEHRFYGKSQPFDSLDTQHLRYLTSQQALHDLAQFQTWLMQTMNLSSSTFLCMGGSYPGNLAAWYRLKFPNMTAGCWAASAPVEAQEVWPGFGQMVWRAVATDPTGATDYSVPTKLYAGYEQLAGLVQDSTVDAFHKLKEVFNVCPGTLVAQQDRDSFEATVSTAVGVVMQYNNTAALKLSAVRNAVIQAETALDAALNVSLLLNLTSSNGPGNCTDNSIAAMYRLLSNSSLSDDGSGNAARTWTWQTCNEFGYFQTATSVFGTPSMYTRGASSRALWQQVCEDVFGISASSVGANIAATNAFYGGKNPPGLAGVRGGANDRRTSGIERVFFSNGELDAWSLLSITDYPATSREVYTEVAPLGSHCVGMYAPKQKGTLPGAVSIQNRAFELFTSWLSKAVPVQVPASVIYT